MVASFSYVRALTAPGYATFADKTSAWLRDHHAGPVVNRIENWYYTRKAPSTKAPSAHQFSIGGTGPTVALSLPQLPIPIGASTHPAWRPGRTDTAGNPVDYTSTFEPDLSHPSVIAGIAVISAGAAIAHLVGGTSQPGPTTSPAARVPTSDVPDLIAIFNSGFRLKDITGGFYENGHEYKALQPGQASVVIDDHGRLTVGQWGRDAVMSPHVAAVRQNLGLIVDNGAPLPKAGFVGAGWGGSHLQYQYTWRSGLGIDQAGNIIYVAGDQLNLATLADALAQAGAVRGMELDMHTGMSLFTSWTRSSAGSFGPVKLLPTMNSPDSRYLMPDRRDFFYLTLAGTQGISTSRR
ncbi:UNVERIFIED_CONTAM: uncharacterized protein DUF2233 [Williamsia faeni]